MSRRFHPSDWDAKFKGVGHKYGCALQRNNGKRKGDFEGSKREVSIGAYFW